MRPWLLILALLLVSRPAHACPPAEFPWNLLFGSSRRGRHFTACKSNLKNLGTALEMYATDHAGRYPPRLGGLTPDYLRTIPTCPSTGKDTYTPSYAVLPATEPTEERYAVFCRGLNHQAVDRPEGFPAYTSHEGLHERPLDGDVERCRKELARLGGFLDQEKRRTGGYPTRLPPSSGCVQAPILVATAGGPLLCCPGVAHLHEGIEPFWPRWRPGQGALPHGTRAPEPGPGGSLAHVLSAVGALVLALTVLARRSSLFSGPRR